MTTDTITRPPYAARSRAAARLAELPTSGNHAGGTVIGLAGDGQSLTITAPDTMTRESRL